MNIKSKQDLLNALPIKWVHSGMSSELIAEAVKRYGPLDDDNFWQHRDFLRLNWDGAEGVLSDNKWEPTIYTGNAGHFLHYSQVTGDDGEQMVSYTKNAENGRADIQTRTTLEKYQDTYGQVETNEDLMPAKDEQVQPTEGVTQINPDHEDLPKPKFDDVSPDFLKGLAAGLTAGMDLNASTSEQDELVIKAVYKALKILDTIAKKGV